MQTPQGRKPKSNADLAALFFAPTGIIVALGIVLILSLLQSSALRLDESQQDAERRLAQSVANTLVMALKKGTADYANWDDMYDQFKTGPEPQWVKENLGPYAIDTFNLSHILVLGADGSVRYGFMSRSETDHAPDPADIAALNGFVQAAMQSWRPDVIEAIGGAVSISGRPHLVALSPITVSSETRKARGERPANALLFVQGLDDRYLASIAADFGLIGLNAEAGPEGVISLLDPLGVPSSWSLSWSPSQVGSRFVSEAFPSIVTVGATVLLLLIVLGFGWANIVGRIRQAAAAAEDANRSKSLFIASMTHELRTPLNAIIGFSELISKETFGPITIPKYREYAFDIVSSGHHLLSIVNNILLFSKMEARRQEVKLEPLNLEEAVSEVTRVMQIEAGRRGVRLTQAPFPSAVIVSADSMALKQILLNVIGNAIKFSNAGGEVRVAPAGATSSGAFAVQVVDTGCGIPKKILGQLGDAFVQADNAFTRKHQGTGLGLAICFGLVKQMGGSIEIVSTENVGTTVSVSLPMAGAAASGQPATAAA